MTGKKMYKIYFDWIKQGHEIDLVYVRGVIDKASKLFCDVIIFGIQEGGYVCYDSTISPKVPYVHDGLDVLKCLVEEAHAQKIKVIPMWLETVVAEKGGGCRFEVEEHPDWRQRSAKGEELNFACFNSPFRDYQLAQVREVLENYEVDGVYFDQFPTSCYCQYCKAKFRKRFNYDIPVDPLPGTREWEHLREFGKDSIKSFCMRVKSTIAESRREAMYVQNVPYWEDTYIPEVTGRYADVVLPEVYLIDKVENLELKGRLTEAYAKKPVWFCVRHVTIHDARVNPPTQTQLLLAMAASNNFSPTLLEFGAFDYSREGWTAIKETLSHVTTLSNRVGNSESIKYCALLHSKYSERFYFRPHFESFEGFHQLLIEQHIAFEIVTEDDIQSGGLDKYKVLVLPNTVCLHKRTSKHISLFVKKGGGVIGTFMSGVMDEKGMKYDGLANVLGRRFIDVVARDIEPLKQKTIFAYERVERSHYPFQRFPSLDTVIFNYCQVRKDQVVGRSLSGRLLSFFGGFVEADYDTQCKVVADILEADQSKINMLPYNRRGLFPGSPRWPLLTVKQNGGRTAYFSGQIGAEARRSGSAEIDQLLAETIRWAGNWDFPFRFEHCPGSVEIKTHHGPSSRIFTVALINLTTSRIQGGHSQPFAVFKYIVPVNNIVVYLNKQGKNVKNVYSLTGQSLTTDCKGGELAITIPELSTYECLTIEL